MSTSPGKAPFFVASLSGGLDSTVLLAELIDAHGKNTILPIFFRYGSKHNAWEEKAASAVATHYELELTAFDLRQPFSYIKSALLLSDTRAIPKSSYDSSSMAQTVVPGRNLVFASVMAAFAESVGAMAVALATHSGDHYSYPDCRPEFNDALSQVVEYSTEGKVQVVTPFSHMTKTDIVALGLRLHVPLHITRSCYDAEELSCGKCGTCTERLAAFAANNAVDPVQYIARNE